MHLRQSYAAVWLSRLGPNMQDLEATLNSKYSFTAGLTGIKLTKEPKLSRYQEFTN